jgi:hypothetical protein
LDHLRTFKEPAIDAVLGHQNLKGRNVEQWLDRKHWVIIMNFFQAAVAKCSARVMAMEKDART